MAGAITRTSSKTNYSKATVYKYKRRAVEEGFLTESVPGKGGQVLTARARSLLAARS